AQHADAAFQKVPIAELGILVITLIVYGISTIMAVAQKIQKDNLQEQNLEKQKVLAELSFLKTQINPHFFFNVLHTIYALIDQDISLAKESVYTLSHMMRYVLYETGNDTTTIEKEIAFIDDYIKLMNLRLNSRVQIIFDKPNTFKNAELAPMLFLPYVENAYKHGISLDHPSYIYIGLEQKNNVLEFEVRNSLFTEKADHLEQSNGIGLTNTKRRLDLLYPEKHDLQIFQDTSAQEFSVKLKLDLK
ncbi:MAG: sensor histidine kinase, partial [Sphingobacteriaceae bacterium]